MAAAGRQVCVTVTHLDGLVYARSVFSHSMNYRSAMIYGTARLLTDARQPSAKELAATSALAIPLAEASVKIRDGGPSDEPEDYTMDVWAGVVPVTTTFGEPEPDAALRPGIATPAHVRGGGGAERCSF
jgi:hypothetical protein